MMLGRGSPRNGADVWLRTLLDSLGFGQYFLLPVLTIVGLLAWHHVEHDRWKCSVGILAAMAGECCLWAAALVGIACRTATGRLRSALARGFLPV